MLANPNLNPPTSDFYMRQLKGVVVSNKMAKTVVIRVGRLKKHPKYKKYYHLSKKFKAEDEKNEYQVGDEVVIQETRPLSKDKRWRVVKLVKRSVTVEKELDNVPNPSESQANSITAQKS